nr:MAG TPA: hypothetical protein [Caudoviricetes sp.]
MSFRKGRTSPRSLLYGKSLPLSIKLLTLIIPP